MSEEEKEVKSETAEEASEVEEKPSAPRAVKKSKKVETAASEEPAPVKAEKPAPAEEPAPVKAEKPAPAEEPAPVKAEKPAPAEKPVPAKAAKAKKSAVIEQVMEAVRNMTVLELSELVKALEAEFGITAAAPVVAAAPGPSAEAPGGAPPAEEKTEFNVILKDIGANKINVIRAVRELTILGLKESKDLVESAPKAVKEGVSKDDAAAAKERLEAAGATVEIT